ncbi:MAG: DUF1294 domain-containing protein [Methanomassiliicoccus sp.]|nr:DUF1294 domain-containing protein [Methanomassiliicoccus sp.]
MALALETLALLSIILLLNVAALVLYFVDKRAARMKRSRIPERTLLLMALVAPFGALAGMRLFRHKTRKTKFLLVYLFLALHLLLVLYVMLPMLGGQFEELLSSLISLPFMM